MNTAAEFPRTDMDALCEIPEAIAKIQLIDVELFNKLQKCDLSESAKKDVARMKPHVRGASRLVELPVIYTRSKGANAFKVGRIYEKSKVGLQAMYRDVRAFLASGLYHDVDIVNAHMSMVAQLCEHWGMKPNQYENILRYVENRDEVLAALSSNRDAAKTEICRIMYGGIADEFDLELSGTALDIKMLHDMSDELNHVRAIAYTKFPQLQKYDKVKTSRKQPVSLFAHLLHGLEAKVILCADRFFTSIGRRMDCLIHDGGLVRKLDGETELPAEVLQGLREYVREHTGFNLQWICKPMKHELKLREADSIPEHETYEAVKARFEKNTFMCSSRVYEVSDDREDIVLKASEAAVQLGNIWFKELDKKTGQVVERKFWPRWSEDTTRRSYKRMEFLPKMDAPEDTYNTFKGYAHEIYMQRRPELKHEPRPPFKDTALYTYFYTIMSNNEDKKYEWLMKLLHKIVFRPWVRSGVMPVFYSQKHGTGKSSFLEVLRAILGSQYVSSVSDPQLIFGKFNGALQGKLVVCFEEGDMQLNLQARMKDLCTAQTIKIERKGHEARDQVNYVQLFQCTNFSKSIVVEPGCRRVSPIVVNDSYCRNADFFNKLYAEINNPLYIQSLYEELEANHANDWGTTEFQAHRPLDDVADMQLKNEDAVVKFWHWLAEFSELAGEYGFNAGPSRVNDIYEVFLQAMNKKPENYGIALFGKKLRDTQYESFVTCGHNRKNQATAHVDHQKMREWLAEKGYIQL